MGLLSNFFKKSCICPPFVPPASHSAFGNFVSLSPPFYWYVLQKAKGSLPLSETFKLLLGCQYGHIIVRRIHTKIIRCVNMFVLLISTRNTKDIAKIVNNLSSYFKYLGTAIFKEHLSVLVSITNNFHCNLPLLF